MAQWLIVLTALAVNFQQSHGVSQLPITPVPANLMPTSDLCKTRHTYGEQTYIQAKHSSIHTIKRNKNTKK